MCWVTPPEGVNPPSGGVNPPSGGVNPPSGGVNPPAGVASVGILYILMADQSDAGSAGIFFHARARWGGCPFWSNFRGRIELFGGKTAVKGLRHTWLSSHGGPIRRRTRR
eukprot:5865662-Pyramimonas_sp.AAC.1